MFERDLTHCPNCGERVTAFAAGCALCGADLDISRFRKRRASGASAGGRSTTASAAGPVDALRGWVRRAGRR